MSAADQINVAQRDYVRKAALKLIDLTFENDPFLLQLRDAAIDYPGGTKYTVPFLGRGMRGGAAPQGATFKSQGRQNSQQLQYPMCRYYVDVTIDKYEMQVLNGGGDSKIYDLVEEKMDTAFQTAGKNLSLALYLPGGVAGSSWEFSMEGLPVACNDNSGNAWTAATYATVGELSRSGQWYSPRILGNVTPSVGTITPNTLQTAFTAATVGAVMPTLGVTTPIGLDYIKNKFTAQQIFNDNSNPDVMFKTLNVLGAPISVSRYVPGSAISGLSDTSDPVVEFVIDTTDYTGSPLTAYPSVTGETFYWINTDPEYIHLAISTDTDYNFGFSGFKPGQVNDTLIGQLQVACLLAVPGIRYHHELNGITG